MQRTCTYASPVAFAVTVSVRGDPDAAIDTSAAEPDLCDAVHPAELGDTDSEFVMSPVPAREPPTNPDTDTSGRAVNVADPDAAL